MDNIKVTEHQIFSITALFTCGSAIIMISAGVAAQANQDAWLCGLITPAWGILIVWILTVLGGLYPKLTFVEVNQQILGKRLGWITAASFVFFSFRAATQLPWFMGNFLTSQSMPETPESIICLIFTIAISIAVLYGIEAVARASEIFVILVSALLLFAMLLVLPNVNTDNLFPMLENGVKPIMAGSLLLSSLLSFPAVILFMLYPRYVNHLANSKKALLRGYLWGSFLMFITIMMSILVLGSSVTSRSKFPIYLLAKEIEVGIIFSRFEFIIAAIWIVTLFVKGILYFYASVAGLAQLLGLKEHRRLVAPLGLIMLVMCGVILPNTNYQEDWDKYVLLPYEITYGFVLPVFLLLIYLIKNQMKKLKDRANKNE